MKIPYHYTATLRTRLTVEQLKTIINTNSEPDWKQAFKLKNDLTAPGLDWRYVPTVEDKSLKKYRLLQLSEAATGLPAYPLCYLKIEDTGTYRLVRVKLRPVRFISIFMTIWGSGVLFATYQFLTLPFITGKLSDAVGILFLAPFHLAFWFFHKVGFADDANRYLRFLKEALQAE